MEKHSLRRKGATSTAGPGPIRAPRKPERLPDSQYSTPRTPERSLPLCSSMMRLLISPRAMVRTMKKMKIALSSRLGRVPPNVEPRIAPIATSGRNFSTSRGLVSWARQRSTAEYEAVTKMTACVVPTVKCIVCSPPICCKVSKVSRIGATAKPPPIPNIAATMPAKMPDAT